MTDRNQQARDQFQQQQQIAKMRREFAAAVAKGEAQPLDRFSKAIDTGALVVWKPPEDFVWLVTDVKPVLDPRMRPGLVEMTLTVTVPVILAVNDPHVNLIVCGRQTPQQSSLDDVGATPETPVNQDPTIIDP